MQFESFDRIFVVRRDEHHLEPPLPVHQPSGQFQAVHARHFDIEKRGVCLESVHPFQRLQRIRKLSELL